MRRLSLTCLGKVLLAVALNLMLQATAGRAEVAMVVNDDKCHNVTGPYTFTIIDDTDPVGSAWSPLAVSPASHIALNIEGAIRGDGPPSMLWNDGSGVALVAWARRYGSGFDIVLSRFENCGWSAPEVVAGSQANELDPYLFLGPDGEPHMVYWVNDGTTSTVIHRQAVADPSHWSSATPVSGSGEMASRPAGVFYDGTLWVSYESEYGGCYPRDVVLARREKGRFVVDLLMRSYSAGPLWSQPHTERNQLWVDWLDITADEQFYGEIAWLRHYPEGQWAIGGYMPFSSAEEQDFHARERIRQQVLSQP